jgi:hypothetical protein
MKLLASAMESAQAVKFLTLLNQSLIRIMDGGQAMTLKRKLAPISYHLSQEVNTI